jgi:hypothetical protein
LTVSLEEAEDNQRNATGAGLSLKAKAAVRRKVKQGCWNARQQKQRWAAAADAADADADAVSEREGDTRIVGSGEVRRRRMHPGGHGQP